MQGLQRICRYAVISMAAIILVGCASQKEPAQKLIADIESTLAASSADEAKYAADKLYDVQYRLGRLKLYFGNHDYAAVVAGGPEVLRLAQGLAPVAAAEKSRILKELNDEWTELAASLPGDVAAIHEHIDMLSGKSKKKQMQGIDLDAAKTGAGDATALWTKAQAAFAAGNLSEAVSIAKDVKEKVEAVAASLKLDSSAAAAPARPAGIPQ